MLPETSRGQSAWTIPLPIKKTKTKKNSPFQPLEDKTSVISIRQISGQFSFLTTWLR